jgi:hypothetical protein
MQLAAQREKRKFAPLQSAISLFLATCMAGTLWRFPECSRVIRTKWENTAVEMYNAL